MTTMVPEALSDIGQTRLKLVPSLAVEKEDSSGVVVVDLATNRRLKVSRSVYDLMRRFSSPEVVADVLSDVPRSSQTETIRRLMSCGFLADPDFLPGNSRLGDTLARPSGTLFRAPNRERDNAPTDVAIVGIPYDSGNVIGPGARGGPDSIRAASYGQEYRCDFATRKPRGWLDLDTMTRVLEGVTMSDWGNVRFMYGESPDEVFERIESVVDSVLEERSFPLCLGGDHSVTYPIVKAVQDSRSINVIWLDAHTDYGWLPPGQCNHHGNVVTRILELPNVSHVVNVGYRGFAVASAETLNNPKFTIVTPRELRRRKLEDVICRLPEHPCYISVDVDVLDPVYAPGTSTPVPDGLSPEEVKEVLRLVGRHREIVGLDIAEVNPLRDPDMVTAMRVCTLLTIGLDSAFANGHHTKGVKKG